MSDDLSQRMAALSDLLCQHQPYWRAMAYYGAELPWLARQPRLTRALLALERDAITHLATDATALRAWVRPFLPWVDALDAAAALPELPRRTLPPLDPRHHAGVPGRKWQQITDFASCVPVSAPLLEWCAGKSYLGFYLQHLSGQNVTALEWDTGLVAAANARAVRAGVALRSHEVDVLGAQASGYVSDAGQVVALHACGELHERLLQLCVQQQVPELHLAPCCYHKRRAGDYLPLSAMGRQTGLRLTPQELHTAVMETATAGAGVQRQRERLQVMRLGFDQLQRDVRGAVDYLPVPSLPARWARSEFSEFCRHCAALTGVALPADVDWSHYLQQGRQRFWQVAALDLVRMLFRRPLEVWLALDRGLLLQEAGYEVRLGTFCAASVTPRNLLLQAWHCGEKRL